MNLFIKGISISLLSLIGVETAFSASEFGREFSPARYVNDYPPAAGADSISHRHDTAASWQEEQGASSELRRKFGHPSMQRPEEWRLSPEQRRVLRNEINEAGRELYRQK